MFNKFLFQLVSLLNDFLSFYFTSEKQRKVSEYYKKQEMLLEGFNEMETMNETGCAPGSLTEVPLQCFYSWFALVKMLRWRGHWTIQNPSASHYALNIKCRWKFNPQIPFFVFRMKWNKLLEVRGWRFMCRTLLTWCFLLPKFMHLLKANLWQSLHQLWIRSWIFCRGLFCGSLHMPWEPPIIITIQLERNECNQW